MKAKIIRTIIDNHGNEYKIDNDVVFELLRNDKCYTCVGVISRIGEEVFTIRNVLIDQMPVAATLTIKYEEVKDGVLKRVSYS